MVICILVSQMSAVKINFLQIQEELGSYMRDNSRATLKSEEKISNTL